MCTTIDNSDTPATAKTAKPEKNIKYKLSTQSNIADTNTYNNNVAKKAHRKKRNNKLDELPSRSTYYGSNIGKENSDRDACRLSSKRNNSSAKWPHE